MNQFIKSKNLDYKNDPLYLEASELIGINKPEVGGSFLKYGKDKACDLDMSEKLKEMSFSDYLKKLISNKKKFILLDAHFDEPYDKLKIIKDKLAYLDGNFKKYMKESILDDIKVLPKELKQSIEKLVQEYSNSKSIDDFLRLKLFVENNLYPKWTIYELKKGEKTYYDQTFKISDYNFSSFYIEAIYKDFRISNLIEIKSNDMMRNDFLIWDIDAILYDGNKSYFKLLKKFMVLIKWLFFNKKIEEYSLRNRVIEIYNYIFNFIEEMGIEYNSICSIKNKLDMAKRNETKYTIKLDKYKNKAALSKYNRYIEHYKKKVNKYKKIYLDKMNNINMKSKEEYIRLTRDFTNYLEKYIRIY